MELVVDRSIDRSHAGSWHGEARAGKPAAACVPDELGVQHAQWGHGQHVAEAPVADGLERGAACLCGGPLPPTTAPLRGAVAIAVVQRSSRNWDSRRPVAIVAAIGTSVPCCIGVAGTGP
jgi:hypothetical protein